MAPTPPDLGFRPTLGEAIRHCARDHGNVDFIVSMDKRMTFAETESASAKLARRMLREGIGKGTRVGLYFTYSHEWVVYWLAAVRIGALVIPLSTVYAPRELGRVIRLADISILITSPTLLGKAVPDILQAALPSLGGAESSEIAIEEAPFLRRIWMTEVCIISPWATKFEPFADPGAGSPSAAVLAEVEQEVVPGDQAVVVYTSGSSADPKGVIHTHGSVLWDSVILPPLMRKMANGNIPKIICGMPFFWVGGILSLGGALLGGMTLIIMPRFDAGDALKLIERERATNLIGWPTLTQAVRAHPDFSKFDLSSAPSVMAGPDVAMVDLPVPGVPMHRGMSETMGTFAGVEIKVVDPVTGKTVPWGEDGEMCVRGFGLMDGYYKKTRSEVFDDDGWFHTGDKVFRVEGDPRSFFRGRYTEMIKTAGANVSPREVELAVESFPGVIHCFVMGMPDESREEIVVAVVAPTRGTELTAADLTRRAKAELSAYKVPSRWIIMEDQAIPWLGSGKPDKIKLKTIISALPKT